MGNGCGAGRPAVPATALKKTALKVAVPRDGSRGGGGLQGPAEDPGVRRPRQHPCTPGRSLWELCTDPHVSLLLPQPCPPPSPMTSPKDSRVLIGRCPTSMLPADSRVLWGRTWRPQQFVGPPARRPGCRAVGCARRAGCRRAVCPWGLPRVPVSACDAFPPGSSS